MISVIKQLHQELKSLRRDIKLENSDAIARKLLRDRAEELGTQWFSEISQPLSDKYGLTPDVIQKYSEGFGRLIKLSAPNNLKRSYIETLSGLLSNFRDELIIPIQQLPSTGPATSLLTEIIDDIENPSENEYMKEAVDCAKHQFYRAAVVLAWCAVIDRIHLTIESIGFAKFNITSSSMASQNKGRFRRFNSPQNISSLNELRQVFDTNVLQILEGMQLIDNNEYTRLRSCFDLRCHSAHPGNAPVTKYNLISFFSDLNEIVLKNPRFKIA